MKMTPQLLEKYYRGLCSPRERKQVEQWMRSAQTEELSEDRLENEHELKSALWQPLGEMLGNERQRIKPRKFGQAIWSYWKNPFLRYGIAASVLFIAVVGVYFNKVQQSVIQVQLTNGNSKERMAYKGSDFLIAALSRTNVSFSGEVGQGSDNKLFLKDTRFFSFAAHVDELLKADKIGNNVLIKNISDEDLRLSIRSRERKHNNSIILKKGVDYIVVFVANDEMLRMTNDYLIVPVKELNSLPPHDAIACAKNSLTEYDKKMAI